MPSLTLPTPNKTPGDGSPAGDMNLVIEAIAEVNSAVDAIEEYGPSDNLPLGLNAASPGVSTKFSRSDHAHPMPTSGIAPTAVAGTAVITTDSRLSDARTPTAHASSHGAAGSDPVTVANTQVTGLGTASTKDFPASGDAASGQTVLGSDTRLTNARTPTAHKTSHATGGSDALSPADIGAIASSEKGANSGVATLDSSGKLTAAQTPTIAISSTFVVASQAAMLALSTAEEGDVAVRTDVNKSFILKQTPPATLANWQELLTPTDAVASVDGRTGTVTLSDLYAALTHASRHGVSGADPITVAISQVTNLAARLPVYQTAEPTSPQAGQIWVQT